MRNDTIANVGGDMEKLALSHIAGGNVKWYSSLENIWQFHKILNRELTHDP